MLHEPVKKGEAKEEDSFKLTAEISINILDRHNVM